MFKLNIIEYLLFAPREYDDIAVEYCDALVVGVDLSYGR